MRILVIKPSSLGDVVSGLAVVPRLRLLVPGCRIDWLANREYAELVKVAGVDEVLVFDRQSWRTWGGVWAGVRNVWEVSRRVREGRYDVVLDLQGLLRSAWFTWVSGAKRRIGYADAREGAWLAYTERVKVARREMHAVDCCIAVLQRLGDKGGRAWWEWPGLPPVEASVREKTGLVPRKYFVLVPGSRRAEKRWPVESWGALAGRLWQRYELPVALIGNDGERALAAEIAAVASQHGVAPGKIYLLAGALSLVEVLGLSRMSKLVIGGDTGPLHAAVAAGAQVVALMGPTDPTRHGPYGQQDHVVTAQTACAPCHGRKRACNAPAKCMDDISVDAVMIKVEEVIER